MTTMTTPTVNAPLSTLDHWLRLPMRGQLRVPGQVEVARGWTVIVQGLEDRSDPDSVRRRALTTVGDRDSAWTYLDFVHELPTEGD